MPKILLWLLICSYSALSLAAEREATIVFAADMPVIGEKHQGDYPELGTLLTQQRQNNTHTFFIFGGGSLGPSPMSGFDRGSHIIDILNTLEPDVMNATKREFSYFEDELSLRSYEAAFPILVSNVKDKMLKTNLSGLVNNVIVEKGDIRLGFVSALNSMVIKEYLLQRTEILDPRRAIINNARQLREDGADFVILLYSSAFPFIEELLNDNTINLALLTDTHLELSQSEQILRHSKNVFFAKPGKAAVINIKVNDDNPGELQSSWQTVELQSFKKDPVVELQVQQYMIRLDRLLSERIGLLATEIDTTRPVVRGQESAFGNFVADTIKHFYKAEIGLINGGVMRGEKRYQANTQLSRRDIAIELPFRSRAVVMDVAGKHIKTALENGLSSVESLKGRFPQVSGIVLKYDPSAEKGSRLVSVKINGEPLKEDRIYRLATSDYLASGGDDYDSLANGRLLDVGLQVSPLLSDLVIDAIRKQKMIAPIREGRLSTTDG